jgi:hypothetical protein
VLEDAREIMNAEMKKPKYNIYSGGEVMMELTVRVRPENDSPYDAKMKVGLLKMHLLKQGVIVRVKYDPRKPDQVEYDDEPHALLERNHQLKQ